MRKHSIALALAFALISGGLAGAGHHLAATPNGPFPATPLAAVMAFEEAAPARPTLAGLDLAAFAAFLGSAAAALVAVGHALTSISQAIERWTARPAPPPGPTPAPPRAQPDGPGGWPPGRDDGR